MNFKKIDFLVNMAPTWPDFGPQDGPKLGPKWCQNLFKNGRGSEVGSGADFGTILDRFWGVFLIDFGTMLGLIFVAFLHCSSIEIA